MHAAYDFFPCQFQLWFHGRAKIMWYDPIFKVQTLDGRVVWRRRHYRVRRAEEPGTFYFSVLDNGVTSQCVPTPSPLSPGPAHQDNWSVPDIRSASHPGFITHPSPALLQPSLLVRSKPISRPRLRTVHICVHVSEVYSAYCMAESRSPAPTKYRRL